MKTLFFGVFVSSFFFFFSLLGMCKFTCTKEFHYHIMASRSNMAAWSGCGIHTDIIYKKPKATTLFIHLLPNTHTVELKANFSTTWTYSFCNCNRPLPLLSVLYNEIDDYRGGWTKKKQKKQGEVEKTGGRWCCHVDALSVMPAWARAVSRAGIFLFVSFLSLKSHTYSIHEISSMFGFDRK